MLSLSMKFLVDLVRWWRSVTMAVSCFFTSKIVIIYIWAYIYTTYSYKGGIILSDKKTTVSLYQNAKCLKKKSSENKTPYVFCWCLPRTLWKPGIEHTAQPGNTVGRFTPKDVLMKASRKTGWWPTSWGKSSFSVICNVLYIPGGAGFLPSIVSKYVFISTRTLGKMKPFRGAYFFFKGVGGSTTK